MGTQIRSAASVVLLGALACLLGACPGSPPPEPYLIPVDQRASYNVDCRVFCEAEAACLAWPDDRHCLELCQEQVHRGAFQPAYVETRQACVRALAEPCGQAELDSCWNQALATCVPDGALDSSMRAWCGRWLECNGVTPTGAMLDRCMGDLETTPDYALLPCFTAAAWTQLDLCLQAAACADLLDLPPLTICAEVFR